jgi:AGZA family xanthine/uracil permease-like MFS transporter
LASIPPWAVGGALIIVGALMAKSLANLNWNKVSHAVSGFLTVMVMPLTYSIAYGLLAGIGAYVVMESTFWMLSLIGIKLPVDEENADTSMGNETKMIEEDVKKTVDEDEKLKQRDDFEEFLTSLQAEK